MKGVHRNKVNTRDPFLASERAGSSSGPGTCEPLLGAPLLGHPLEDPPSSPRTLLPQAVFWALSFELFPFFFLMGNYALEGSMSFPGLAVEIAEVLAPAYGVSGTPTPTPSLWKHGCLLTG